jgi:hypothetical protein
MAIEQFTCLHLLLVDSKMFKMVDYDMLMGLVPILIAAVYWFLLSEGLEGDGDSDGDARNSAVVQQRLQWEEHRGFSTQQ